MGELLLIDPEREQALRAAGLRAASDLLALGDPDEPRRYVGFVSLGAADADPGHHVKRYRYAGWRESRGLVGRGTLWGIPPEVREFRVLQALRAAGVPAVRPVAACATWRGRRLSAHALLTEAVHGARDLHARLRTSGDPLAASPSARHALVRVLGSALRRMHDAGFAHRDCFARNILVRVSAGEPEVWLLDCRRGGGRMRRGRDDVLDLATLDRDLRGLLTPDERVAGLYAYLGLSRDDDDAEPEVRALGRRVAPVRDRLPPPRGG